MRKTDNLTPSCAVVMKSGNLNFLEPSGPFQACNGTALPLPVNKTLKKIHFYQNFNLNTNITQTILLKNNRPNYSEFTCVLISFFEGHSW